MNIEALVEQIRSERVVPVVVIDDAKYAVPLAKALVAGGVHSIEITFRTAAAEESIRRVSEEVPEMLVGAGTLITVDQVKAAVTAGAKFAVAPGCREVIVKSAQDNGLPFFPGVMTPTDVENALSYGCKILKFFPAESAGGVKHLKSLIAPYQNQGIQFIPTGGIDQVKARDYLALAPVLAVGGSWLAPKDIVQAEKWDEIERIAKETLININ